MAVSAGRYRHRIKIYKDSGDRNKFGGLSKERILISKPWARLQVLADNEIVGTTTESQPMHEFEIRFSKTLENELININSSMFLVFRDIEYDIISVKNVLELNEKLIITTLKR